MESGDCLTDEEVDVDLQERISITDEQGKAYEFEKPDFECELLAIRRNRIYGYAYSEDENMILPCSWFYSGKVSEGYGSMSLTPIKKAWYEDESNFPCLVANRECDGFYVIEFDEVHHYKECRPATKEEALKLVVED